MNESKENAYERAVALLASGSEPITKETLHEAYRLLVIADEAGNVEAPFLLGEYWCRKMKKKPTPATSARPTGEVRAARACWSPKNLAFTAQPLRCISPFRKQGFWMCPTRTGLIKER